MDVAFFERETKLDARGLCVCLTRQEFDALSMDTDIVPFLFEYDSEVSLSTTTRQDLELLVCVG